MALRRTRGPDDDEIEAATSKGSKAHGEANDVIVLSTTTWADIDVTEVPPEMQSDGRAPVGKCAKQAVASDLTRTATAACLRCRLA
jgi:hypothetical protein